MTGLAKQTKEIEDFINEWSGEEQPMRDWFELLYQKLLAMENIELFFVARPGVSFSMRPKHMKQTERELFAMVDVIDDDSAQRWLSVCFYGDMITDPEGRGELIPGGLMGSDGYCFDMFESDKEMADYLVLKLQEACVNAAK